MKRYLLVCFLIFGLWVLPAAPAGQQREISLEILDQDIRKALGDFQVPGMAIAIVRDGQTILLKGYGVRNIEGREPVDEYSVFGLGSASKTFAAGLAAVLVHEGRLRWEDKVADFLPEFKLYDPWLTKETRMNDLLSHRVGVADLALLFLGTTRSREDVVARTGFLPAMQGFRTGWAYNNILFITAGQMMARIAEMSWDEALREKIFSPLGMTSSGSLFREIASRSNRVSPHWYENGHPRPIPWSDMDTLGPAGSVYSNAADLAKWMKLHLGRGTLDGRTLWNPEIQKTMFSPHSLLPDISFGWPASFSAYALGWFVTDYRGRAIVWHSGNCDGMSAVIGLRPDDRLGIAILQNTFPTRFESDLMLRVMDMFAGLPQKEWRALGEAAPMSLALKTYSPGEKEKSLDPSFTQNLEGRYISDLYGTVDVRREGERLILRFGDYPAAVLHLQEGGIFFADFGHEARGMFGLILGGQTYAQIEFTAGRDGLITELSVKGFGSFKRTSGE